MGLLEVGRDWATSLSLFTFMQWRRKWQPTPVFLPGESQGQRSLMGCRLWGCKEWEMTEHSTAAAAKSLQSCPTLHDTIDDSQAGSPIPGILQARTLEWVAISFSNFVHSSLYLLILCPCLPFCDSFSPSVTTSLFSVFVSVSFLLYSLVCFLL